MARFSITRRTFFGTSLLMPIAGNAASVTDRGRSAQGFAPTLEGDVAEYFAMGSKRSGGAGDEATTQWLGSRLARLGFSVEQQPFHVPAAEVEQAELRIGRHIFPLWPQRPVVQTIAKGLDAPLRMADCGNSLEGCIAVVDLPFARWSTATAPAVREPINEAIQSGAVAVVLVTNGPTGKAVALNAPGDASLINRPVGILAPDHAADVIATARAGGQANLLIRATQGVSLAHNLFGKLDRGIGRSIVVSTPKSGWFGCAGERGPGIAIWLALAEWAAEELLGHDLFFVSNSGHEYENLGAREIIEHQAPDPDKTAFWLHLGAGIAARDWHDLVGGLRPLPSADPQRYLLVSDELLNGAAMIFSGQPGLERPYSLNSQAAGELLEIAAAGYRNVAGVFGAHRFHHTEEDNMRTIVAGPLQEAAEGFRKLLEITASR